VLILAGAIVFVASARMLPETAPKGLAVPGVAGLMLAYARVLKSSTFLGYALCSGCCAMAFFAFLAGAPYVVVEHLGYPPVVYSMAFAAISVGYMIGNMTANRLSVRIGAPRMVAYGTVVTILGCIIVFTLAFTGVEGMAALFLPMMLVAIGNGMLQPNAIAAAVSGVDPSAAGTASGAAGCLQMLLGGLATQLVGFLHTGGGALPTGTVMLTGALVGTAFYWLLARRP
jgi:DHA1 family bicyclomycin/chloramphenicol resistance-like MFS transporter